MTDERAARPIDDEIERVVLAEVLERASRLPGDPADAIWGAALAFLRLRVFMVEHGLVLQPREVDGG